MDLFKLTDTIELVPPLDYELVLRVLSVAFAHWSTSYTFIPTIPAGIGDKLGLDRSNALARWVRSRGDAQPLDALTELLSTPRALKHVVSDVNEAWSRLHGEVNLADLIIVTTLRYGAEEVIIFLVRNIDEARHAPDKDQKGPSRVKEDWNRLLANLPHSRHIKTLVDRLGIEQLSENRFVLRDEGPQDVRHSEPTDYFRRILSKDLSTNEIRDQNVLRDIEDWNAGRSSILLERMLTASTTDKRYISVWEHFASSFHKNEDLLRLASHVIDGLLARDGANARGDDSSIIAIWRIANKRVHVQRFWLEAHILRAIGTSLNFANDLFYYWTGQHGIVDTQARMAIRRAVVDKFTLQSRNWSSLAAILSPTAPYSLVRLITMPGEVQEPDLLKEWSWLGPILIEGAREVPDLFLPEIATMIQTGDSGMMASKDGPPVFLNPYEFDNAKLDAIFGGQATELLQLFATYAGVNPYATRPRDRAAERLAKES